MRLQGFILAAVAFAAAGQTQTRFELTYNPALTPIEATPGAELEVELTAAPAEWAAGFQLAANLPGGFSAALVRLKPSGARVVPHLIESLEPVHASVSAQAIRIPVVAAANRPLILYFRLPSRQRVVIRAGPQVLFAGIVTEDLLVKNGVIRQQRVMGAAAVAIASVLPEAMIAGGPGRPQVTKSGEQYRANVPALRQNLLSKPQSPALSMPLCCEGRRLPEMLEFELAIGPDGRITSVHQLRGPAELGPAATAMLNELRFTPFREAGAAAPVAVLARLPVTLSKDGTFVSPLH
jgi:hypothetical protein